MMKLIKNKGVPKSALIGDERDQAREMITFEHYRKALFDGIKYNITHYAIRSFKHQVITMPCYKLGISADDFKRAHTTNRAITLPFGYKGQKFANIVGDADDNDNLDP